MGYGINKLRQVLENQQDYNVLVTILTDGEENSSVEYSKQAINQLVNNLKETGWTFTYIGTDHDVEKAALDLSISNTMKFEKNETALNVMFEYEIKSRKKYSEKIRAKEDTRNDFYEK